MFSIINADTTSNTEVKVTYKEKSVTFNISAVITKRSSNKMTNQTQYVLLNGYLDYKGDEFKETLFNECLKAKDELNACLLVKGISPLPVEIISGILSVLDMEDIFYYLKNIYKLNPPSKLEDEFDPQIEIDGRGTRVQTYTKTDYLELASLAVMLKTILGPLCEFAYCKSTETNSLHKEYILFNFIKKTYLFKTAPMQKLLGLIEALIYNTSLTLSDNNSDAIRVLEKNMHREEIPIAILGLVVIQKVSIAPIITDNNDQHMINVIYNYVNNGLKSTSNVSNVIRQKDALLSMDDDQKESLLESYRNVYSLSSGDIEEFNWIVDTIDVVIDQLPDFIRDYVDIKICNNILSLLNSNTLDIHPNTIKILSFIFKDIMYPKMIEYLRMDKLHILIAVGFSYLWNSGFRNLALLIISTPIVDSEQEITLGITINRSKLDKTQKDELDKLFPYRAVVNATTSVNVCEEDINNMTNEYYDRKWQPIPGCEYFTEYSPTRDIYSLLPSDIRGQIANLIIMLENKRLPNLKD